MDSLLWRVLIIGIAGAFVIFITRRYARRLAARTLLRHRGVPVGKLDYLGGI